MLGSLLKYDFKALNKVMLPLQLGVLAAGIVGAFFLNLFVRGVYSISSSYGTASWSASHSATEELFMVFGESMSLLVAITLLSIVFVSGFITLILIARNVYRNFYSSEGYLTFTLPVSIDQHLQAKTISGFVWMFINSFIILLTVGLLLVFGTATEGLINTELVRSLGSAFAEFLTPMGILYIVELVLLVLVSTIMSVLQIIFSFVLGGAAARTHKVLAGIGIYLASGAIISTLMSIFLFFVQMSLYAFESSYSGSTTFTSWLVEMQPTMIISTICYLIFVLVFYFISKGSLKKNLNLE